MDRVKTRQELSIECLWHKYKPKKREKRKEWKKEEYTLIGSCGNVGAMRRVVESLLVAPEEGRNTSKGTRKQQRKATERGGRENSRERRELLVCVWF